MWIFYEIETEYTVQYEYTNEEVRSVRPRIPTLQNKQRGLGVMSFSSTSLEFLD